MTKFCIIGNDSTGKSTTANLIVELYSTYYPQHKVEILSYAAPLKEILATYKIPVYSKPYTSNTRNVLRAFGDAMREVHGERYWSNIIVSKIKDNDSTHILNTNNVYIIDDMRYWSEFNHWLESFEDSYVIVIGYPRPTTPNDADSVVQVNELINFLRNDNHNLGNRLLLLEGNQLQDAVLIKQFISKINNK